MTTDSNIGVQVNVKIGYRQWIPDPNGELVGQDGQRGSYAPIVEEEVHNLLTDDGRDFLHQQGYETTGLGTNGANYIALTSDTGTPAVTDTTLASEITTGGLARAQGTVAHTTGATTTTIQYTFTATATHSAVQKSGLFTAASAGIMVHEASFMSVNLQSNDQLQITWTITLSE